MAKTYAMLETKSADLATDFGLDWAKKLFGDDAIASLPVRTAGKNKGSPKGYVIWRKAIIAGYCRDVCGPLAVGQMADAWIGAGPLSTRGTAVAGQWLGRTQSLAATASAGYFFEEGRAREATRQARYAAELQAEKEEIQAEIRALREGAR